MRPTKPTLLLFTFLALSTSACEMAPTEVTIYVYGQGGNFSGEYTVDGESDETLFYGSETTSDIYKYTDTVEIEDSISINIYPNSAGDEDDADETDMTDVTFRVYQDDVLQKESSYTISSTLMKTFEYSLDETTAETAL